MADRPARRGLNLERIAGALIFLAGAIWADQRERLSGGDGERDPVGDCQLA